jgi:hypothetical protein
MFETIETTVLIFLVIVVGCATFATIFMWIGLGAYKVAVKNGTENRGTKFPEEILAIKYLGAKMLGLLFVWILLVVLLLG